MRIGLKQTSHKHLLFPLSYVCNHKNCIPLSRPPSKRTSTMHDTHNAFNTAKKTRWSP
jgi:hypothetical protein